MRERGSSTPNNSRRNNAVARAEPSFSSLRPYQRSMSQMYWWLLRANAPGAEGRMLVRKSPKLPSQNWARCWRLKALSESTKLDRRAETDSAFSDGISTLLVMVVDSSRLPAARSLSIQSCYDIRLDLMSPSSVTYVTIAQVASCAMRVECWAGFPRLGPCTNDVPICTAVSSAAPRKCSAFGGALRPRRSVVRRRSCGAMRRARRARENPSGGQDASGDGRHRKRCGARQQRRRRALDKAQRALLRQELGARRAEIDREQGKQREIGDAHHGRSGFEQEPSGDHEQYVEQGPHRGRVGRQNQVLGVI